MVNLKKRPSTKANLPRHGHDLSTRVGFSSSVGQLIPVLYDWLNPGEAITVNRSIFTRTVPLKSPAFVQLTEHVDYFFCPMMQINTYFGNAYYGISDFINPNDSVSSSGFSAPQVAPTCTLSDIRAALFSGLKANSSNSMLLSTHYDEFGVPVESNTIRLLIHLGYSDNLIQNITSQTSTTIPAINLNLLAVYQKIFMDYYRLTDWTPNNPFAYSLNHLFKSGSYQSAIDSIKGSYGEGMFRLRYRPLKKDFFTNVFPTPLFTQGVSVSSYTNSLPSFDTITNKSSYILSTLGVNMEFPWTSSFGGVSDGGNDMTDVFQQHDGDENGASFPVSLSMLRTMYAWQRLASITQRASKHYDSQTLAHFGFKVPQGVSNEVYFLGSHSNRLQIGEVVSTATTGTSGSTSSSVLGQLAGRGVGSDSGSKPIKFVAPCHGYMMAIYSAVPEVDYASSGLDRLNTYNSINDYYHPEFDNIGMVPMYKFEFIYNPVYANLETPMQDTPKITSDIIGWNYRYYELKMKPDRIYGSLNYAFKNWASTRNNTFLADNNSPVFGGAGFYCSPRYLDNIFEHGFITPSISGIPVLLQQDGLTPTSHVYSPSPVFDYDPLLHIIDFKYYKSSYMSPYGLPRINS